MRGRGATEVRFSTFTSHKAYNVYQDFLTEVLTLITTCEGTLEGIAKYLNISKHMMKFSEHTLLDYLGDNEKDVIEVDEDPVVVFADFSRTQISKNTGMIMSKVGDNVLYKVCPNDELHDRLELREGIKGEA